MKNSSCPYTCRRLDGRARRVYILGMTRKRNYKVLCDADREREKWLKLRHDYLTGSAISALFGLTKWKTRAQVVSEKSSPYDPNDSLVDSRSMYHGRMNERVNMQKFADCMGLYYRPCNYFVVNDRRLGATLDGLCSVRSDVGVNPVLCEQRPTSREYLGDWMQPLREDLEALGGVGLLEMKQTRTYFGKQWIAETPRHYYYQVQVQLMVTGLPWAVAACQVGTDNFIAHLIRPDWDVQAEIQEGADALWKEIGK